MRVVGFAARAAYLIGGYHPSLEGIYLAFSNAGYGASLANVFLVTAVWCAHNSQLVIRLYLDNRLQCTGAEPCDTAAVHARHTPHSKLPYCQGTHKCIATC